MTATTDLPWRESYDFSQLELGIGDIICSLHGLYAFSVARQHPPIRLHMRDHFDWLKLLAMPNLRVLRYDEANPPRLNLHYGDDEAHYREKMRGAHDPKVWYAHKLGVEPLVPPVHPAVALTPAQFPKPLVVLSPFATRINRTWEVHNWRILARNLTQAGFNVIAIDGPNQPDRCREIGVKYFWGYAPEWVANVCHHANLIITGDSGLAHFGGWLGTPTLVIMSQQEPTKYYSMTHNQILRPNAACVECRFQPDRGYEEKCDFGCWALQSISPTTVTEQALAMLLNPQPKR